MKKLMIGSLVGILVISANSAYAGHAKHKYRSDGFYDRARVTHVEPLYRTVRFAVPGEQCYQQEVRTHRPHHDDKVARTIIGGLIGGAIGHKMGNHKRGSTIAGAVIGAAIGSETGHDRRYGDEYVRYEEVCEATQTFREEQRIDGYQVTYRYKGEYFTTRMDRHPGKRIRVRVHVSPVVD